MGGDPEKDYFAAGITEDVITELSRWRSLAVTSRNSTFRFKGKAVDMQRLGLELGVRFLVEGSVRRMGERIRITAQLIDAESGNHVWGERFDRPMADLFAVQDQVVQTIVGTLVGRVQASGADRARRRPPSSLDAYDHVLRGNALPWDDPAAAAEAKRAFERAIEIDPGYGLPHSLLAALVGREWENDLSAPRETLDRAFALAQRAVELAEDESTCHTILGQFCLEQRLFDLALHHTARGVEMNPANQWEPGRFRHRSLPYRLRRRGARAVAGRAARGPVLRAWLVLARSRRCPVRVAPPRRCLAGFRARSDEQLAPGARHAGGVPREPRAFGTRAGGGGAVPGVSAWRHCRQAGRQDAVQGCRR